MRVLLYQGISDISQTIRKITRSNHSHTGFLCKDGSVYEAREGLGVVHTPNIHYKHSPGTIVDIYKFKQPLSEQEELQLKEECKKLVGLRYDYESIFRFITLRDKIQEEINQAYHCSEFVAEICHKIGRPLFNIELNECYKITPGDIKQSNSQLIYECSVRTIKQ
jgi:hypothetical protein